MATGRTTSRWVRTYIGGLDMSGYSRSIGPLAWEYPLADLTVLTDAVRCGLPDTPVISCGTLNAVFDNTAGSGLHVLGSGTAWTIGGVSVVVPIGIRAVPAQGDPTFCGIFRKVNYQASEDGGAITASIEFASAYSAVGISGTTFGIPTYTKPWGVLLHTHSTVTAVNSAAGIDDAGAASALGGIMFYGGSGNGTATLKVQDAANNADGDFADLSGCTSGVLDLTGTKYGYIEIGHTDTVRRYLRWQIVLGTATSVTFHMAFIRG